MLERIEIIDFVVFMKRPLYENNGFMGKKRKKNSKNFVVFT